MKYASSTTTSRGFTLIELMIASAIFIIIVMAGTQILVTATNNYRTTSEIRQSLDTLNFVMEDMTRNIRLGTNFDCDMSQPTSCPAGTSFGELGGLSLAFNGPNSTSLDPTQIAYWLYSPSGDSTKGILYKMPEGTPLSGTLSTPIPPFEEVTPPDMFIDLSKSGFSVSDPGGTTTPMVTIRLAGTVEYGTTVVPFDVQSTIAPRNLLNL